MRHLLLALLSLSLLSFGCKGDDDDDDEVDLSLPRYSAELSRLETSLRTRQAKLASFQASQVARARLAFGLDPTTGASPGAVAAGNGFVVNTTNGKVWATNQDSQYYYDESTGTIK